MDVQDSQDKAHMNSILCIQSIHAKNMNSILRIQSIHAKT